MVNYICRRRELYLRRPSQILASDEYMRRASQIFKLRGRSFYVSLHQSVGRMVGLSVKKVSKKEVLEILMTVQVYSKVPILC